MPRPAPVTSAVLPSNRRSLNVCMIIPGPLDRSSLRQKNDAVGPEDQIDRLALRMGDMLARAEGEPMALLRLDRVFDEIPQEAGAQDARAATRALAGRCDVDVLRADGDRRAGAVQRDRKAIAGLGEEQAGLVGAARPGQDIGAADEIGDEAGRGLTVDQPRLGDLLDEP